MPDLVKKWKERHPYLTQLEDDLNAEEERKQKEDERKREEQLREYSQFQAEQNRDIAKSIKLSSPLEIESRAQEERIAARNTGPNFLTPAMEAEYQRRNGVNRAPNAYQTYMMQVMNAAPAAPETRSNTELRRDANRQTMLAAGTTRMAADMGNQLTQDQSLIFNPTYTSNLRTMGQTMEAQQNKAAQAQAHYQTVKEQRKAEEAWSKYSPFLENPDFLEKSKPDLSNENRVYYSMAHSQEAIEENGANVNAAAYATDDEKRMYYYLWNTQGSGAANAYYYNYVEHAASARKAVDVELRTAARVQNNGFLGDVRDSFKSIGTNAISGIGLVDIAFQNIGAEVSNLLGLGDPGINYYSPAQMPGIVTDAIRSNVAKKIAASTPGLTIGKAENAVNVASFLYETGMSMADSTTMVLMNLAGVPKWLTLGSMGASAGTRAVRDAKERGASDWQALAFGVSSAIMEALFEKVSLDSILKPSDGKHFKNAAKQTFVEGSEEFFTNWGNTVADQVIMGDKSELLTKERQLMEQGYSQREALGRAAKEWCIQIGTDAIGGLLSGFGMGGAKELGTGIGVFARDYVQDFQTGRAINDALRQEQAAPVQEQAPLAPAPQAPALTISTQETQNARRTDPLGYALEKVGNGETLTGGDARAILENPQAVQSLRDAGVLTEAVKSGNEGRKQINAAVAALAEQNRAVTTDLQQETERNPQPRVQNQQETAQERTAPPMPEQRQAETPAPQSAAEGRLRIREQTETPPLPSRLTVRAENGTLRENRQEGNENVTVQEEAQAATDSQGSDFAARARIAAAGRQGSNRSERTSGVGRLLEDLRTTQIVRGARSRADAASRLGVEADVRNQREVSAQDLGVQYGTEEKTARLLDNSFAAQHLGRDWTRAVEAYAQRGVKLQAMTGQLQRQMPGGETSNVRAFVSGDGKTITVQADHPYLSWNQLLDHEELHRRIKEDAGYRQEVQDALLADETLKPRLAEILDAYTEAYRSVDPTMTAEDINEELLADYRAGFDMLDPLGLKSETRTATKAAAKDIRAVEKRYTTNGGQPAPEGITEQFAEAKNSVEPPYKRGTAALAQFEGSLSPTAKQTYDLFNTLNDISRSKTAEITVGAGKAAHLKWDTIADKSFFAQDWNNYVRNNKEFAEIARELVAALPQTVKDFGHFNDDGTVTPTEFEEKFKMNRSFIQRVVDALPKNVVQPVMNIDGHEYRISDKPISGAVGGEEYRQAIIAEKRRLYKEGKLPTVSTGTLSHDNWGAMGFLATNTKTGASGDFTTFCPQMYFNNGCFYCYRRAALTSGSNNKLTGETVWYSGEILQLRDEDIHGDEGLNKKGGLRIQSFGDWQDMYTPMLADMLYDAQMRGLQVKIITKEPSMIETVARLREQALGLSLYFNLSADYTIERRGESDNHETRNAAPMNAERPFIEHEWLTGEPGTDIGWKRALSVQEANEYRKKYPWVNTRIVATTLKEYIRGLIDPTVDVVTGYHGKIKYQERVSSETGETLIEVEALGDSGMPRFAYDEKTGTWTTTYRGKTKVHKALCDAIEARGLQKAYYDKACCITGHCAECQGQCGAYANKMSTKNALNRDSENLRWVYAQMEMHPGAGMENSQLFAENVDLPEGTTQAEDLVDIYDREHGIEPLREKPVEQQLAERDKYLEKKRREAERKAAKTTEGKASTEIGSPVMQEIGSADTSRNQVASLFTNKRVNFGDVNIDIGGGKWDKTTNYLAERGTKNMIFDPFNRSEESNTATLDFLRNGERADTATCANVLNVIKEPAARANVILETAKAIKPDGTAYFVVYEGNGTGEGKETRDGWQENRKTEDYMDEIRQYFGDVQRYGKLIEARQPNADLPEAQWGVTPNKAIGYSIEIDPEVAAQFSPEAIALRQSNRTKGVKGERKVSRVRTNTYAESGLFNEVEAQMDKADESNYEYDPISEKKSMNEARSRLKADFDGEVSKLSEPDYDWGGSDLDTAMGILHRYRTEGRATGDYTDFWNWSKTIQKKGTKGGQFIQAFAKYTRTGTGTAAKAAAKIHEQNQLTPAQQKQVRGHVENLMNGMDAEGAAGDAMKQAKGQKESNRKQDGKVDKKKLDAEAKRRKDAERLIREMYRIFNQKQQNHGERVEDWLKLTGEELAKKIASRFDEKTTPQKTTMQTILSDLVGFAEEHALPERKKAEGERRTAIDTITDYLNNRDAYGAAWAQAQGILRSQYAGDQEKLDALDGFLGATIAYNAEGTDRTMLDAILQSADVLGISEKRIKELASAGATRSTIDRIGDELVSQVKERMGADWQEEYGQQLKDAVRRHITGIALSESASEQALRLGRLETAAAKELDINLQKILTESRLTKQDASRRVADYLIRELDIPSSDAAIAAQRISESFMDELAARADKRLGQMFGEKVTKAREQRDKLLDLLRLGGFTNANVEDAVVDALGIGKLSREEQKRIIGDMARFGETLDAMEADDLDGLKDLIRAQAGVRNTPLSRQAEKALAGETDAQYLREFALAQLDAIAGDFAEMSPGAKISTFQTISHLLNMRTALRNLTSNQVFDLVDSAANNLATIPDMVIGAFTGKRTVGANKGWFSEMKRAGAKQGAARNALEVRLDVSPDDRQKSKYGTAGRRTNSMAASNAFGRLLSHLEEVMGYELNTTDEFHKGSVRGETLESLARFVERGDITQEQANAWAEEEALYRSFQDDTLVGNIMGELKTLLNVIGFGDSGKKNTRGRTIHDFGLGDLVVKYTQVPGALIHRGIEYSPLGYAKMIYDLAIAKDSLVRTQKRGEDVASAQRKLALDIGRATTGSGLITLFAALAKAGLLRRDDDDKDKNAKAMHAAQGLSGTQLNLTALERWISGEDAEPKDGDVLADIGFLEPLDSLMTIATLLAKDKDLSISDVGVKSLDGVWKAISSTSAMQTISNIISTVQYHDEENDLPLYFQIPIEIASDSISGFIPSTVRQLAQATDTTYRDQYRSKNVNDQVRAKVMNSIPGVRQMLAPKITPLGEDKKYQKPLLNYLNSTLNPGNITVYEGSELVDELNRLYDETNDKNIWPERNAPYSFELNKEPYTLTPDERTQYQRTRGQQTAILMDAVRSADWYSEIGANLQAEILHEAKLLGNYIAKVEFSKNRGVKYSSDDYAKYLKMLQDGTDPATVVREMKQKTITLTEAGFTPEQQDEIKELNRDDFRSYLKEQDLTDEDKLLALGAIIGTEMTTEAGNASQWANVNTAVNDGQKVDDVLEWVNNDLLDDYMHWRDSDVRAKKIGVKEYFTFVGKYNSYKSTRVDGKEVKGQKKQDKVTAYIDSLNYTPEQKDALYLDKYTDAKLDETPWHGGSMGKDADFSRARIPTLRIPTAPKVEKPSSGLRITARAQEAARPRSGLRIRAQ